MKICPTILSFTQVFLPDGSVRPCGWLKSEYMSIGKLSEQSFDEIWHGEKFRNLLERQSAGDFSVCDGRACSFCTSQTKELPLVEIDKLPEHPTHISLSYERVCNYHCNVCWEAHSDMFNKTDDKMIEQRKIIEKNLMEALPHAKFISANGCGELFASKSIMNLLANWRPLAPKEECSVYLETNGSLFDEEHWKQIENLGQYHVTVVMTVMSFDEKTYQACSGVKYPISRIENNLRFIKSLRDKGIINEFRITTVVQERNFRTLPEWFRRCDEEFGADSIRMRAFVPYEARDRDTEWLFDIRNKYHPYHQEYLEMIKDPVFQNPKLLNWGLFQTVERPSPFQIERDRRNKENRLLREMFNDPEILDKLKQKLQQSGGKVIIHGAGAVGIAFVKALKDLGIQVKAITDHIQTGDFIGVPILNLKDYCEEKELPIIVTWLQTKERDYTYFRELGYTGEFIKLEEIFDFDKLFDDNCGCK